MASNFSADSFDLAVLFQAIRPEHLICSNPRDLFLRASRLDYMEGLSLPLLLLSFTPFTHA